MEKSLKGWEVHFRELAPKYEKIMRQSRVSAPWHIHWQSKLCFLGHACTLIIIRLQSQAVVQDDNRQAVNTGTRDAPRFLTCDVSDFRPTKETAKAFPSDV